MKQSLELYACLYAKEFPTQAMLRLRPELRDKPCVVMEGDPPLQQVSSLNRRAQILGVTPGMARVEIDTFPYVTVLLRSPSEEVAAKSTLLECAGGFSPRVEDRCSDGSFLCIIDIVGTEKLLGSPKKLADTLLNRVKQLGFTASVAISSNFDAAISLARGRSSSVNVSIIPSSEEAAALASLPLNVLDVDERHAEIFRIWGISTLGMLATLPEKELIARMGQEGKRLRQLARGELPHLFLPMEPVFALEERMELDAPVELISSLLFVAGVMLEQLIVRAAARVLALVSVTIVLTLEGGASHTRTIRSALPTNNRQLWIKLIHLDLEAHPPNAAILALTLAAEPGITSKVQLGLFSPQLPEPARLDVTLARIRAIVGEECVGRAVLKDTHQPDRFHMEPFTIPPDHVSKIDSGQPRTSMRQLRPSESTKVRLHDRRPASFIFRHKRYAVEEAYGPWLTGGDWWNPTLWGLEQWDLVARSNGGALLCCCLVRDLTKDCWQMAALYD